MKNIIAVLALVVLISSCSTLNSTTTIKPNDSFLLGNNQHRPFKVKLKNISKNEIEVYHAPINGGKHSSQIVQPNETVTVKIEKNTACIIANKSGDTASVKLKVTGDTGLSMGYKN